MRLKGRYRGYDFEVRRYERFLWVCESIKFPDTHFASEMLGLDGFTAGGVLRATRRHIDRAERMRGRACLET